MPIERLSPDLDRLISPGQEIEELASGYTTPHGAAEGPLWHTEGGYLIFSDIGRSLCMKWAPGEGVTRFQENTNEANGITWDLQARLLACEGSTRRVTRQEPDGSITVVAGTYRGTRLNRPNDVVMKSDGSIYFTDPGAPDPEMDLEFSGVFRVSADLGTLTLLVRDFVLPNGLAFSPDESVLYVDDSYRGHTRAFDVQPNGTLGLHTDRVFCDMRSELPGLPDGMKVDVEGNVYCTGSGGVWVIDPSGRHLGTVLTGANQTTNVAFGGGDMRTLFITTRDTLARIQVNVPGLPVPPKG